MASKTGDEKAGGDRSGGVRAGSDSALRRGSGTQGDAGTRNVGDALRAVYHDAVSESVPDELLELLKKLG